jgi:hypothetical protein
LNRKWGRAGLDWAKENVPEIYAIRDLLLRSSQSREVVFYCDMHGHNRKNGVFMYGCNNDNPDPESIKNINATPTTPKSEALNSSNEDNLNSKDKSDCRKSSSGGKGIRPASSKSKSGTTLTGSDSTLKSNSPPTNTNKYKERVFPLMLSRNSKDLFYFKRCQFRMQKSKQGTGRITVRKAFGVINSFTMEASFCGSDDRITGDGFHFSTAELERMGESLGKTLYDYFADGGKEASKVHKEIIEGFQIGSKDIEPDTRYILF